MADEAGLASLDAEGLIKLLSAAEVEFDKMKEHMPTDEIEQLSLKTLELIRHIQKRLSSAIHRFESSPSKSRPIICFLDHDEGLRPRQ